VVVEEVEMTLHPQLVAQAAGADKMVDLILGQEQLEIHRQPRHHKEMTVAQDSKVVVLEAVAAAAVLGLLAATHHQVRAEMAVWV
jgi:hypothetical protein